MIGVLCYILGYHCTRHLLTPKLTFAVQRNSNLTGVSWAVATYLCRGSFSHYETDWDKWASGATVMRVKCGSSCFLSSKQLVLSNQAFRTRRTQLGAERGKILLVTVKCRSNRKFVLSSRRSHIMIIKVLIKI